MWLGLEVELLTRANHAHHFVVLYTSRRHLIEREIRSQQHQLADLFIGTADLLIDLRYPCPHFAHLDDHLVGFAPIAFDSTDLFGDFVAPGLELIRLTQCDAAAFVQPQDLVDGLHEAGRLPPGEGGFYDVRLASEPSHAEHVRGLLKS